MTAGASRSSAIAPPLAAAALAAAGRAGRGGKEGNSPHHLATVPDFSVPAADRSCPEVALGSRQTCNANELILQQDFCTLITWDHMGSHEVT